MAELAALIGAVVATIGTIFWETRVRPAQQRANTASVLRIEVASNRQQLIAVEAFMEKYPEGLPSDLDFESSTFDALVPMLGSLKVHELVPTMQFYHQVRYLARLAASYKAEWEMTRTLDAGSPRKGDAETRLHNIRASFRESLALGLETGDTAFARLDSIPKERLRAPRLEVTGYEAQRQAGLLAKQRL